MFLQNMANINYCITADLMARFDVLGQMFKIKLSIKINLIVSDLSIEDYFFPLFFQYRAKYSTEEWYKSYEENWRILIAVLQDYYICNYLIFD